MHASRSTFPALRLITWSTSCRSMPRWICRPRIPDSDWQRLCAVVPDDRETLWWVFGLGENVKVLEPKNWVQVIREKAAALEALYTEIELP
ncbi:WCX domain-containing protein [Pseudomonas paraeruginosa]|uniref:WYL domain-containing protein n=1 Tax=Pseudomonas paraeruginosa TaxID=2994495 RepID=UPI003748F29B